MCITPSNRKKVKLKTRYFVAQGRSGHRCLHPRKAHQQCLLCCTWHMASTVCFHFKEFKEYEKVRLCLFTMSYDRTHSNRRNRSLQKTVFTMYIIVADYLCPSDCAFQ